MLKQMQMKLQKKGLMENIIVTGGYQDWSETTRALVHAGAQVIIAKRIEIATNLDGIVSKENIAEMDLGNLNSVKKFTDSFKESFSNLDLLINNAELWPVLKLE